MSYLIRKSQPQMPRKPISFLFRLKGKFILLLGSLCLLFSCSPNYVERIVWFDSEQNSSNYLDSYKELKQQHVDNAQLKYLLANDSTNLYISMRIPDERLQLQIMLAGMSIYLDSGKAANHKRGITYPIANDFGKNRFQSPESRKKDKATMRKEFLLFQNEFQVWGFNHVNSGYIRRNEVSTLQINFDWDSLDVLIYEAIIPLSEFYHSPNASLDTTAVFNFGITINELTLPSRPPGQGTKPEGDMSDRGMPPEGNREMPMSNMTQKKSFQYTFSLCSNE